MSVTAFLTDSTLCIGCKACEVACKEWNGVSEDGLEWSGFSYDNTEAVGASTWRHVKFVERPRCLDSAATPENTTRGDFPPMSASTASRPDASRLAPPAQLCGPNLAEFSFNPMYATVVATASLRVHLELWSAIRRMVAPSNAPSAMTVRKSDCSLRARKPVPRNPSNSEKLKISGARRSREWKSCIGAAWTTPTIYDPLDTSVEGTHAFFIVRGDPRTYNLPPAPEVPTTYLKKSWRSSAIAAGLLLGGTLVAFLSDGARRDGRRR